MADTQPMLLDDDLNGAISDPAEQNSNEGNKYSFLSMSFYQYYFNVSTATVLNRIRRVFLFRPSAAFSVLDLEPFPDMCGPVWIFMTVWLASVMCSDIGDRFLDPMVSQDFSRVAYCFCMVLGNAIASITGILVAAAGQHTVSFGLPPAGATQVTGNTACFLSLFGYSLAPFVPAVLLCILPWSAARISVLILAAIFTSLFLAHDMWFILSNKIRFLAISVYLFVIQILFSIGLHYFIMNHSLFGPKDEVATTTALSNLTTIVASTIAPANNHTN